MKLIGTLLALSYSLNALALFGSEDMSQYDYKKFMQNSTYQMYACTTITKGTNREYVAKQGLDAKRSYPVMAQNMDEAKAIYFNKMHLTLVKSDNTNILKFNGSGAIFIDVDCSLVKELEKN